MRYTKAHSTWLIQPVETINVEFYDNQQRCLGFERADIRLGEPFASGSVQHCLAFIRVKPPAAATRADVQFGMSGLATQCRIVKMLSRR